MKIVAFVFARGGSKGLPGKNIREFQGAPLISHAIRCARSVESISDVYVSTDSTVIADIARSEFARVIERPIDLARDDAPEWLAWRHAMEYMEDKGLGFDIFVSLPATSPLRLASDVEDCIAALDENADAVVTVTPSSRNPYFNMVTRNEKGVSKILLGGDLVCRRQDAPCVYDLTTVAYVTSPAYIMAAPSLFSGVVKSVVIPRYRAVDIDDEIDFKFAELAFNELEKISS